MASPNEETPSRPPSRSSSFPSIGYIMTPFEKWKEENLEWSSAYTLLDTFETFFDARFDLWERRLKKQGRLMMDNARDSLKKRGIDKNIDKELARFKEKVGSRMQDLNKAWHSTKVVRTREKVSFFLGVYTVLGSALMVCLRPEWVYIFYTIACLYLLPLRFIEYKQKAFHYFLFDLCYYVTILNIVFIWLFPSSPTLFVACYCLSHGSLASAVITWRNSLVFHDVDKVTSLFIHIYAPFTFTTIRHYLPNAASKFPALAEVPHLNPLHALLFSSVIYCIWQGLYWQFVYVGKKAKVDSGQRVTSFSYLLADKRGAIGKALSQVPEDTRVWSFMLGQFIYSIATEIPAVYFLYDSERNSTIFLLVLFGISVWNGGGFYIEVFGRKFEKELEALRKEVAEMSASRVATPAASTASLGDDHDNDDSAADESADPSRAASPASVGRKRSPRMSQDSDVPLHSEPKDMSTDDESEDGHSDKRTNGIEMRPKANDEYPDVSTPTAASLRERKTQ